LPHGPVSVDPRVFRIGEREARERLEGNVDSDLAAGEALEQFS